MSRPHEIAICICTFQRPHIAQTLASIANIQTEPQWNISIIIADNDETPSSKERVEGAGKSLPFPLTYVHAPARNISIARNACLNATKAPIIVFIDDDEIVEPQWLSALIGRMDETNADAVIGPVKAIYEDNAPSWIKDGDFHARSAVYVNGKIVTGYTANALFNRNSKTFKARVFRLDLGQSGGEDSTFFKDAYKAGAKIEYAANAWVSEDIPEERTKFKWLLKRRFREGQTHGMMVKEQGGNFIINIMLAASKSCVSLLAAPFFIVSRHRFYFWIFRAAMHAGVVAHLCGVQKLVLYGHNKQDKEEPANV